MTEYFSFNNEAPVEELRYRTNRGTKFDVVRDALAFYEYMLNHVKSGKKIYIGENVESLTEIQVSTFK
jgi:hypothetical protein